MVNILPSRKQSVIDSCLVILNFGQRFAKIHGIAKGSTSRFSETCLNYYSVNKFVYLLLKQFASLLFLLCFVFRSFSFE